MKNSKWINTSFIAITSLMLIGLLSSFSETYFSVSNNLDKSNGFINDKGKKLEWLTQKNYRDTIKVLDPESGKSYDDHVLYSSIEVCKSINGKSCQSILNSYVHLNKAYNEKLSQYIKSNYPDNLNGVSDINLNNVVIDENGLIQYYDYSSGMRSFISSGDDMKDIFISESDRRILENAVHKFVQQNRTINLPEGFKNKPTFIKTFAQASVL